MKSPSKQPLVMLNRINEKIAGIQGAITDISYAVVDGQDPDSEEFSLLLQNLNQSLSNLQADQKEKVDCCVHLIEILRREIKASKEYVSDLRKDIQAKEASLSVITESIKRQIEENIANGSSNLMRGNLRGLGLYGNGGKVPIEYDVEELPEEYVVVKVEKVVDSEKLRDYLEYNGGMLVDGDGVVLARECERGKHIRIL